MKTCPHCHKAICIRELPHQGLLANFRIFPHCGGSFTVDTDTQFRQAVGIFIALVSLIFTMLLYFCGDEWLMPALISYLLLGLLIWRGNKLLYFVSYDKGQHTRDDT